MQECHREPFLRPADRIGGQFNMAKRIPGKEEFDETLAHRQLHVRLTRLTRGVGGAVITMDDVTDLARAQRVLAWGEMARQVAHEIKNPLTPIAGPAAATARRAAGRCPSRPTTSTGSSTSARRAG